ncbi:Hsp20/alpha crystallin family protein [Candidatus Microgenomates bacterium]|nr:Hsp20/alpha crystallin family protein [Candidatus Microgenomates bacterium]
MAFELTPWRFPAISFPSIWEDFEEWLTPQAASGLSVSEDEKNIYVEAALPGIDPKDIDITFDKGVLTIKGEAKEEEKKKKYYRKAARSFYYRVPIPKEIDPNAEPEANYKNGVMMVTFAKSMSQPKKITVKTEGGK